LPQLHRKKKLRRQTSTGGWTLSRRHTRTSVGRTYLVQVVFQLAQPV
jgi:hypothetical protein